MCWRINSQSPGLGFVAPNAYDIIAEGLHGLVELL